MQGPGSSRHMQGPQAKVFGIPDGCDHEELKKHFAPAGDVKHVKVLNKLAGALLLPVTFFFPMIFALPPVSINYTSSFCDDIICLIKDLWIFASNLNMVIFGQRRSLLT